MKLPYYTVITDKVEFADSKMCRIRLNSKYENHKALIAHEEMHVLQWYVGILLVSPASFAFAWYTPYDLIGLIGCALGFFAKGLAYTFSPKIRYELEIMAYRAQAQNSENAERSAKYLAGVIKRHYKTKETEEEILVRLLS